MRSTMTAFHVKAVMGWGMMSASDFPVMRGLAPMFSRDMQIAGFDDALFDAMQKESARQEAHIELIASENYASPRVLEAQAAS